MQNTLKNEVSGLILELNKAGKGTLANHIQENWNLTLLDYSSKLHGFRATKPLEPIFIEALATEFYRLGLSKPKQSKIFSYLKTHRNLQTGPHVSPAQKPRYFFINYLHSLGLNKKDPYLVAMFSGIPFSNKTRPGRLSTKSGDINLIPSALQDDLVYQSKIDASILKNIENLDSKISKTLPEAKLGMDYTAWALKAVQKIEGNFLHGTPVFFDFNEVVKNYFLLALLDDSHPLSQLLFEKENLKLLEDLFKGEVFFYGRSKGKYPSIENYYLKIGALQSSKNKIVLNKENLVYQLEKNSLCVGLPLSFLIFAFLNEFLCCGSFAQVEYLPKYKEKFSKIPILKNLITDSPSGALTTGGFPFHTGLHALDIHLGEKVDLKKYEKTLFGEAIMTIKDVLLYQNYSTKYEERKTTTEVLPQGLKKVHLIGICGKGMSGLAIMLKQKGYIVSGSDEGFYEPVAGLLKKNKIKIKTPHKKENIPFDADFIIIGKHAKLVPETNPEVREAFTSGIPIKSLPEAIGDLLGGKENTVVVGSFGKSTMTALITHILKESKKPTRNATHSVVGGDPSYFIGAVPLGFKQNAYLGNDNNFILEGDEYPSANWDNTSKMQYMNPINAVLTSGEHDHINVFPTEESYIMPFEKFATLLPKNGLLVACKDGKNVERIAKKSQSKIVYYGIHEVNSYHAENIVYSMNTTFDLYFKNKKLCTLSTNQLGRHNIENIIGASAFVLEKKLVSISELQKAIKNFKGLSGRLDLKPAKSSVLVYEGFGSSYAKAKSVFEALSLHYPNKRLITIFEPHTFSWRNEQAKAWYNDVFDSSNIVLILPPPEHGSSTHTQMSQEDIVEIVKNHKRQNVYAPKDANEALSLLKNILHSDDLIALVTSGSLFGLTASIPSLVEKLFQKK